TCKAMKKKIKPTKSFFVSARKERMRRNSEQIFANVTLFRFPIDTSFKATSKSGRKKKSNSNGIAFFLRPKKRSRRYWWDQQGSNL
ncbi:MAG: hypothetical protein J6R37_02365, partial [Clostridia bacterium]|nr:hypothetical protein [Clostridia bacterium]